MGGDLDADLALEAAAVGLEEGLALADSEIYALGKRYRATLGTQDSDFRAKPGLQYTPKPPHADRAPD